MKSLLDFITSTAHSAPDIACALFLAPFLHEDVAITAAALLVAQNRLSVELAFPCIFLGMVVRDLSIYGLERDEFGRNRLGIPESAAF
jgi:membrane protein DedA with SNARE-associated domain